jgi:L-ascorbate metabolism protein UlaG (beta-lactamase superfamily)
MPTASPSTSFPVSDHCDGRRFFNPRGHVNHGWLDVLKWRRTSRPTPWPRWVEVAPQPPPPAPRGDGLVATWINHATFLLQTAHGAVLTDPVFSERAGPFNLAGPPRVHAPGVRFEALPRLGVVLLSHDHYDHCDLATLRRIARVHDPLLITPLGNGQLARRAGLKRVVELDWWQTHEIAPGFAVTVTPSRHWSNRLSGPRNGRLWGGFFLRAGGRLAHFVGDTAYDGTMYREIREKLGAPQLALVPIGAYEPRWFMSAYHCNPAEAVQIHRDLGAQMSAAMHWGTWQLTDEGRDEPPTALAAARTVAGLASDAFRVLLPGESVET